MDVLDVICLTLTIEKWTAGDTAALWFCRLLLIVLILILHMGSFLLLREETDMPNYRRYVVFPNFNRNTANSSAENYDYYSNQEYAYTQEQESCNYYNQETASDKTNNENNKNTAGNSTNQKTAPGKANNEDSNRKNANTAGNSSNTNSQANVFQPFSGCNDINSLKKRYRQLVHTYHPDENGGDSEAFTLLQKEYERLLDLFQNR